MTRPAFGGNTIATIACPDNRPQMATVRPGVMQKIDKAGRSEGRRLIEFNPGFTPDNKYVEILEIVKAVSEYRRYHGCKNPGIRWTWRWKSEENFKLLEDLAEALGGDSQLLPCRSR